MPKIKEIHYQQYKERNEMILRDKRMGVMKSWELVKKYRLSMARINQIVSEMIAMGY